MSISLLRASCKLSAMEDDWIISSIRSYELLHTFDLPQCASALDWGCNGNVLYVGGSSLEQHSNEILELSVPEKILNPANGLCSKRDFTMSRGGFSSTPVTSLKLLTPLDKLATVGHGNSVGIYSLSSCEKGMIKHLVNLRTSDPSPNYDSYLCWNDSYPTVILNGCIVGSAALVDVEKNVVIYQCSGGLAVPLNGLAFTCKASNSFFTLSCTGSIELWDPRVKGVTLQQEHKDNGDFNTSVNFAMDVCGDNYEDAKLMRVSRLDECIEFYDIRQWTKPVSSSPLPCDGDKNCNRKHLCAKFSPHQDGLISLSGYSEGVCIYKTGPSLDLAFTHKGHEAETHDCSVLTHLWHPTVAKLLVSTSADGALHSWQWKHDNKSATSELVYKI